MEGSVAPRAKSCCHFLRDFIESQGSLNFGEVLEFKGGICLPRSSGAGVAGLGSILLGTGESSHVAYEDQWGRRPIAPWGEGRLGKPFQRQPQPGRWYIQVVFGEMAHCYCFLCNISPLWALFRSSDFRVPKFLFCLILTARRFPYSHHSTDKDGPCCALPP